MTTSPMSFLAEPHRDDEIGARTLGYISEATRDAIYDFIIQRLMESGVTRATLARRLGKDPSQVSRTLGAPGNWTIDTCAELLFAIDGSTLQFSQAWPLRQRKTNRTGSMCVNFDCHPTSTASSSQNATVVEYRPVFAKGSGKSLVMAN